MPGGNASAPGTRDDPGALCLYAAACWDRAFRGYLAEGDAGKSALVQDGLRAVTSALQLAPADPVALTWQVLLLRLQAALEQDPGARAALDREADARHRAAVEAQKDALIRRA
jgi:hypothetical protein